MKETITKQTVEELVLGINENQTEAWKKLQAEWNGGCLPMPEDERERRQAYRQQLKKFFLENGIDGNTFPEDSWLSGKIKRILEG